jgi:SAM-dependent methyltransferase
MVGVRLSGVSKHINRGSECSVALAFELELARLCLEGMNLDTPSYSSVEVLHDKLVLNRRVKILSRLFAELIPKRARLLDVGCGDGLLCATLQSLRPDITVQGLDVLVRSHTHIPVEAFDGSRIPFGAGSFDVVMFSDVLHHSHDPLTLQREAWRVAAPWVLIKDHRRKGFASSQRLRFMDWVGNSRFGVALPYNYWTEKQWDTAWRQIGLRPKQLITHLGLYPPPADWVFGAQLHFIALLKKCDAAEQNYLPIQWSQSGFTKDLPE